MHCAFIKSKSFKKNSRHLKLKAWDNPSRDDYSCYLRSKNTKSDWLAAWYFFLEVQDDRHKKGGFLLARY